MLMQAQVYAAMIGCFCQEMSRAAVIQISLSARMLPHVETADCHFHTTGHSCKLVDDLISFFKPAQRGCLEASTGSHGTHPFICAVQHFSFRPVPTLLCSAYGTQKTQCIPPIAAHSDGVHARSDALW
jgi:hypothetical protein